jgi:hypothetical protein
MARFFKDVYYPRIRLERPKKTTNAVDWIQDNEAKFRTLCLLNTKLKNVLGEVVTGTRHS